MRGAAGSGVSTAWIAFIAAPVASSVAWQDVHRPAHRAGGVDAGAPRLVRKADEVRVGEAVPELRHVGPGGSRG